jgi:peptide/nickel transport system substrate-binding protein/oligopeptide transport system substrate-binding protein
MKRRLSILLALIMVAAMVLGACGKSDNSGSSNNGNSGKNNTSDNTGDGGKSTGGKEKQLIAEIGPNPETIDPALNSAVDGGNMLLFTFDCLLNVDKDNKIIPGAAEKYETSKDGLKWTFYLRKDLKWSDGSPLTAKDFVYS